MIDQTSQFLAILTNVGVAKQANANALGIAWKITHMGVGDANGTDPQPAATQTALINERRRAPLNQLKIDPANSGIIIAEQVIPAEAGGFWIREIGLYDEAGDLVAVANCAPSFKPLLNQGSGRTQVVRMNLIVSNSASVELKIDPSVVLATRGYVDQKVLDELSKQDFKHSVVVATTGPIALSGEQTIDDVPVTAGLRVLARLQPQAKDNGLYIAAVGAWVRAADADISLEVTPGLFVHVEKGTLNGESVWQLATDSPITLGVTSLVFEMAAGRTGIGAGTYRSVTVDKYGRVVAGTSPTTVAGYGITDAFTKAEIEALMVTAGALPVGAMLPFPRGIVPPGFLEVDGTNFSAAVYPDLAAYLGGNTLPESRGEFLRGWDHGRGVNVGRGIGTYELDEFKAHYHLLPGNPSNTAAGAGSDGGEGSAGYLESNRTDIQGGSETRPRNLAVMWCIKAWSAPINQGVIDVAALAVLAAQASESNQGTSKVATQAMVEAGADDATFITPKKLFFGFSFLIASIGFIRFPDWAKRLTIAWGGVSHNTPTNFPIGFNAIPRIAAIPSSAAATAVSYSALTATSVTLQSGNGTSSLSYLAVGFS